MPGAPAVKPPLRAWIRPLLIAGALLGMGSLSHAQTVAIIRDVNFGTCEYTASAVYTVTAAATQGASACPGAASGQIQVTALPNRVLRGPNLGGSNDVTITNGTQNLGVNLVRSPSGQYCSGPTGIVTLYVGGTITLPAGTYLGLFAALTSGLAINYQGTTTC